MVYVLVLQLSKNRIKVVFKRKTQNKTKLQKPAPTSQGPVQYVLCASWLIWVPVCSPRYLTSSEVLTVHRWHPAFHAFILGIYVSLLSIAVASQSSDTERYHQQKGIYDFQISSRTV